MVNSIGHTDDEIAGSEVRKASSRLKILRITDFGFFSGKNDPMRSYTEG